MEVTRMTFPKKSACEIALILSMQKIKLMSAIFIVVANIRGVPTHSCPSPQNPTVTKILSKESP